MPLDKAGEPIVVHQGGERIGTGGHQVGAPQQGPPPAAVKPPPPPLGPPCGRSFRPAPKPSF